jgi:hypothetical protein
MCLVKIIVEVYVQQKTHIKCLVVVAFEKCFLFGKYQNIFKKIFKNNF